MNLVDAVAQCSKASSDKVRVNWTKVYELVKKDCPECTSPESCRARWKRLRKDPDAYANRKIQKTKKINTKLSDEEVYAKSKSLVLDKLRKPCTISNLVETIGEVTRLQVLGTIEELKLSGYIIKNFMMDREVYYELDLSNLSSLEFNEHRLNLTPIDSIKLGVVSDTHIASKYAQITYLNKAYDRFQEEGIKLVFHAGDLTDGFYKNRDSHIYELHAIGFEEQKEFAIKVYPRREGIVTKVLGGNHDATHIKRGGS